MAETIATYQTGQRVTAERRASLRVSVAPDGGRRDVSPIMILTRETVTALLDDADALATALAEVERLRDALMRIGQWDCLNPPQPDLLADLPWLRRLVDGALALGDGSEKGTSQ